MNSKDLQAFHTKLAKIFPSLPEGQRMRMAKEVQQAARVLTGPARIRPTSLLNELEKFAKAAGKLQVLAEELNPEAWRHIFWQTEGISEIEPAHLYPHLEYLTVLAEYSRGAAETAQENVKSTRDHKGGRTPDWLIFSFAHILAEIYHRYTGERPTHTTNPEDGRTISRFDKFVQEAMRCFSPPDLMIQWRALDNAILETIAFDRDFETFTPPRRVFGRKALQGIDPVDPKPPKKA